MPVLVIHALSKMPQKASVLVEEINIGRDITNDVVLAGATVSRRHASISKGIDGRWTVTCASQTNPIVVDGALIRESAEVIEGTEILVGTEFLLVFSKNDATAQAYMGSVSRFTRATCAACGWTGMVSALNRRATCPKCASLELKVLEVYDVEDARKMADEESTHAVSSEAVRASLSRLREASRSHIERIDGKAGTPQRADLSDSRAARISKDDHAELRLLGLAFGKGLVIRWTGSGYTAESTMLFPGMKINGIGARTANLKNGDVIQVGGNRFRLVTE